MFRCWGVLGTMRPLRIVGCAHGEEDEQRRGLREIGRPFWAFYYYVLLIFSSLITYFCLSFLLRFGFDEEEETGRGEISKHFYLPKLRT